MMVKPEYPSVAEQRSEHAALAARPVARAAPPRHHRLRHTRAHGFVPPRGCDKREKHHQDGHQEERSLVTADDVLLVRQTLYVLLHELVSFLRRVELVRPLRELGLRVLGGRWAVDGQGAENEGSGKRRFEGSLARSPRSVAQSRGCSPDTLAPAWPIARPMPRSGPTWTRPGRRRPHRRLSFERPRCC